jgi:polysaccharide biosynthesis transport protein
MSGMVMNAPQEVRMHLLDYWRVIRVRIRLVTLVFLCVVITTGIATYLTPREYRSSATIEVTSAMTPIHIFDNQTESAVIDESKFSYTQFQIILRKGVLYPVIDQLGLEGKWATNGRKLSKEAAYDRLRKKMTLEAVRNTDLIQITIYSGDPQEAALIANTIAEVYMEQRIAEQESIISNSVKQLRNEVSQKEEAVRRAYAEASRLRTEANIIDPNPENLDGGGRVEDTNVITNQEKVNEIRSQVATLRSRVAELDRLRSEDLMRAAGELSLNDPILEAKLPIYQTAQAEEANLLNSGLGRNHPAVKALQAQMDTIAEQLQKQVESIRKVLSSQLRIAENSLKAMGANLQASQDEQQALKTASARYLDAKYKYIQERKFLEAATTQLNSESMGRDMPHNAAVIRERAEPAVLPSKPSIKINMVLGIAAGVIAALSLAFFLEYLDTSIKTLDEVEYILGMSVLGIIPKGINYLPRMKEDAPDAEAYRILKTNVDFIRRKTNATVLNVTSGGASEGKSMTVCNLAATWAASARRVLIVDADMRRPSQHRIFEMNNRLGLSDYLKGQAALDEVIQLTTVSNLYLLPSGPPLRDPVGLLNSEAMTNLVEVVKQRFDIVLVDSPPVLGVSDGSIISRLVDSSIIVVRHRYFPRSMLLRTKKTVENIEARLLGAVLNNVDMRYDRTYQYYTSYDRYYTKQKEAKKKTAEAA